MTTASENKSPPHFSELLDERSGVARKKLAHLHSEIASGHGQNEDFSFDGPKTATGKREAAGPASSTPTENSTAYNTNAVPSDHDDDFSEQDLGSLPPLEGFEWRDLVFEEIDPLDLRVMHGREEIKLMTYRWAPANERKAVVFLLHGYGSCSPHLAVLAKFLAANDYEVFAFDYRGQGDSEGERGVFLNSEQIYGDCWAMIFEACKKFKINQQKTPLFLFGRSFGGLLASNMANTLIGRSMFAGVVLLTPYYRLFTERLYDVYRMLIPLSIVKPNHKFVCEYAELDPEWVAKYKQIFEDTRNLEFFTAMTARLWVEEQETARTSIAEAPMPICFITATEDGVVRNDYIEEFAALAKHPMNELHKVVGANHTDVCFDENYGSHFVRSTLGFIRKIVARRD